MFRPLGIGEIFDRAITIYTRNFVVFTLMVLTLLAPFTVLQFYATPDQSQALTQAIDQIEHPTKKQTKPKDPFADYTPQKLGVLVAAIVLIVLCTPFVNNAIAVGVAAVYFGKQPDYRSAFGTVFRRWPAILGAALLTGLVIMGVYLAGVLALGLVFVVGVLLAQTALPLAVIIFIIGTVGILALILLLMLMVLCYAFALYSISLEDISITAAIGTAFGRIFNRAELGKAILIALAYLGVQLGITMISATVGMILLLVFRSTAAQLAANAVIASLLTAFVAILLAVYYYDVRTRREGLDLEADLQRLTA